MARACFRSCAPPWLPISGVKPDGDKYRARRLYHTGHGRWTYSGCWKALSWSEDYLGRNDLPFPARHTMTLWTRPFKPSPSSG